ncbi:MAG: hypothetical protein AAF492_21635, partial [Verrucomicrobiota bacterium]
MNIRNYTLLIPCLMSATILFAVEETPDLSNLKDHFDAVVSDHAENEAVFQKLVAAEPELARLAAAGDRDSMYAQLSKSGTDLLKIRDGRNRKRNDGNDGFPPNFGDRLAAFMLVTSMPDLPLGEVRVKLGRDDGGKAIAEIRGETVVSIVSLPI